MLNFKDCMVSGLVLSATTIGLGLSSGSAFATGGFEEFDNERVVKVNCNKGQSVQRVLNRFANRTKPLEVIIKGNCIYEPDNEIQIERDNVSITGDEDGAIIPSVLVDGARLVGIGENLTITGRLDVSAGMVEIGSDSYLIIGDGIKGEDEEFPDGIGINSNSLVRIDTEEPDDEDDEEELIAGNVDEEPVGGIVTVNGQIWITNHSILEVQREQDGGMVFLNGAQNPENPTQDDVIVSLQSSLDIKKAEVGNIYLERDSHAAFNGNVVPVENGKSISCDSESRVWQVVIDGIGDTEDFTVNSDPLYSYSCLGN